MEKATLNFIVPSFLFLSTALLTACGSGNQHESAECAIINETVRGTISYCHDGDTCVLDQTNGKKTTLRLAGIDAPEVSSGGQPFGKEAQEYLSGMIKGKQVSVREIETDPYDRTVAEIFLKDDLVNIKLVQQGLAEAYRYATNKVDKKAYAEAETKAKKENKGIWSLKSYESPSDFRQRTKI